MLVLRTSNFQGATIGLIVSRPNSHDVTKIQATKLLILLTFYFHDV